VTVVRRTDTAVGPLITAVLVVSLVPVSVHRRQVHLSVYPPFQRHQLSLVASYRLMALAAALLEKSVPDLYSVTVVHRTDTVVVQLITAVLVASLVPVSVRRHQVRL